jgi:uncharacterized protein YegL
MPINLIRKPKASKIATPSLVSQGHGEETSPLAIGLDLSNRTTRTSLGWVTDGSPSMTGFTQLQLDSAVSMVDELRKLPSTARSVMMNIVQLGTPSVSTGFQEIAKFQVPPLHVAKSTPLHTALDLMTNDLGSLFSDLRANGIERTESVVIITTDGFANDNTPEGLANAIPPLHIEELNAAVLMPFIQKIARQVSESRRGQKIELELPDGIEPIE